MYFILINFSCISANNFDQSKIYFLNNNFSSNVRKNTPLSNAKPQQDWHINELLNESEISKNTKKKHQCSYCNKVFDWASHLQRHIRAHVGERPFVCQVCHKGFSERGNLNKHYKTHKT